MTDHGPGFNLHTIEQIPLIIVAKGFTPGSRTLDQKQNISSM